MHKPVELFTKFVLTLLDCHGCPMQAKFVAAFGLEERTVAAWRMKAARHYFAKRSTSTWWSKGGSPGVGACAGGR